MAAMRASRAWTPSGPGVAELGQARGDRVGLAFGTEGGVDRAVVDAGLVGAGDDRGADQGAFGGVGLQQAGSGPAPDAAGEFPGEVERVLDGGVRA